MESTKIAWLDGKCRTLDASSAPLLTLNTFI
ncbi:uncharacterized protein METZ01_LOCUS247281 [marine metagenome]|uniref:Uncharacterized protein n=1 Tax=marine metagenome TaxID=408172 RepID=A0A382I5F2_9ZZZZ